MPSVFGHNICKTVPNSPFSLPLVFPNEIKAFTAEFKVEFSSHWLALLVLELATFRIISEHP